MAVTRYGFKVVEWELDYLGLGIKVDGADTDVARFKQSVTASVDK